MRSKLGPMTEPLHKQLVSLLSAGEPVAYGVVVETRGSTPQKPGAEALFLRDGRVVGTLGGGCLEAESRQRALRSLDTGAPALFELGLDDDFGWDDGLVCGGTARVFVQPLAAEHGDVFGRLTELQAARAPVAAATVIDTDCTEWLGRRCLLDGKQVFTSELPEALGAQLHKSAAAALTREGAHLQSVEVGGQSATVFVQPHVPRCTLLIAGAGHLGQALTHLGALTGFDVVVVDDRLDFANRARLPEAREILVEDIESAVANYPLDDDTFVVVVTRGHRHDAVALRACLGSSARYLGMIGSRRKIRVIFDGLLADGHATEEQLARVHTPIGLDLGAVTVEEIAVSIVAEMIAVRRKGSAEAAVPMRLARSASPAGGSKGRSGVR